MGKKHAVAVLIAAGAVFWLLGGGELFSGGAGDAGRGAGGDGADMLDIERRTDAKSGDGEDAETAAGPVLFGRPRAERKGLGGLGGRVMDFASGEPVAGANVIVAGTGYGGEVIAIQADTDTRGRFRYHDLAAGDAYTVHVNGAGAGAHQRTLAGVGVDAGDFRDLGTLWLGEQGVLEGVVKDADGEGIVGADVHVHRRDSLLAMLRRITKLMERLDQPATPLASTRTQAGGAFRIEALDPGPILLVVRATGYRQATASGVMTANGVAGGPVDVVLDAAPPISGTVVDEEGRGIAGARVACLAEDDMNAVFYSRLFDVTDAGGSFRIQSPPDPDDFAMIVAADGYPTLFTKGEAGSDLRLVMLGGVRATLRFLEKASGRPIEGASVTAMFSEDESLSSEAMNYATGTTDVRGEVEVRAREGKLAMLYMSHPAFGTVTYAPAAMKMMGGGLVGGPEDTTITKPAVTLVFRIDHGLTVAGHVLDEAGAPIAGARVSAWGGMGFGPDATSDAEGRYELRGVSPSMSMLLAQAPGYVQEDPQIAKKGVSPEPDASGRVAFDIQMKAAGTVTGRVTGPGRGPLTGVRVRVRGGSAVTLAFGTESEGGITNADGRYVIDGAAPGADRFVMARMAGYVDARSEKVTIESGKTHTVPDIEMRRGTKLTLTITAPGGAPLEDARVEVSAPPSGGGVYWDVMERVSGFADVRTRAGGRATIEALPTGTVTITASHADHVGARRTMEVAAAQEAIEARIALREAVTLRGRVLDAEGEAVAGASVQTATPDGSEADEDWIPTVSATTDKAGRFQLEGLPDRSLSLEVNAEGHLRLRQIVSDRRGEIELRLVALPAGVEARLAEIEKELMAIYGKISQAKDDDERQSLFKRIRELQTEQGRLEGEGD
jgi:protocatechuate 3,4-dioxygenase beta subunit